ncbi:DinB family protein [Rufibacter sediminis]|uniref:DinB family protein n=1 Tax=Rufibacter sediminis TaxID=2762756 RepID=A0ABR6VTQ2_9BACT|nr:DinB family protein [Rufibacter sediminis]MBC3540552.1 DinB family protein [Rufibacter sediminis]
MKPAPFLTQLQEQAHAQQEIIRSEFLPADAAALNFKPHASGWSVLECVEHLNRYSRFYLPHLERAITITQQPLLSQAVRYSWIGRKSLDVVNPLGSKKYKTLKHLNPHNSHLTPQVLDEFLQHQDKLLHLLEAAAKADLNKKAIPVEFFRLLKMRLGEALEFLLLHQQRHLLQAQRAKEQARHSICLVV